MWSASEYHLFQFMENCLSVAQIIWNFETYTRQCEVRNNVGGEGREENMNDKKINETLEREKKMV